MNIEFIEEGALSRKDEITQLISKNGLDTRGQYFDAELFWEHYETIKRELRDKTREQKMGLYSDYYFDAIAPGIEREESKFIESAITEPPKFSERSMVDAGLVDSGSNKDFHDDGVHSLRYPNEFYQYGPVRISDVMPGNYVITELDGNDIVATRGLTACQVIYAKRGNKVFLAHSLYGNESRIPGIVKKIKESFGENTDIHFVYPEYIPAENEGADFSSSYSGLVSERDEEIKKEIASKIVESARIHNEKYLKIAEENGLITHGYFYPRPTYNPHGIGETAIVISRLGVTSVEASLKYTNARWKHRLQHKRDISEIE